LAWTPVGGDIMFVEAIQMPGKGQITLTGQLGDVMKESAQAAWSLLRARAAGLGIPLETFTETDVHLHVPAGAVPKDGPSAGITMATALASLLCRRPARNDLAMTGELTLRGRVQAQHDDAAAADRRRFAVSPDHREPPRCADPHAVGRGSDAGHVFRRQSSPDVVLTAAVAPIVHRDQPALGGEPQRGAPRHQATALEEREPERRAPALARRGGGEIFANPGEPAAVTAGGDGARVRRHPHASRPRRARGASGRQAAVGWQLRLPAHWTQREH